MSKRPDKTRALQTINRVPGTLCTWQAHRDWDDCCRCPAVLAVRALLHRYSAGLGAIKSVKNGARACSVWCEFAPLTALLVSGI